MIKIGYAFPCLAALALTLSPALAGANARLISVVSNDGSCVSGPTGHNVESWDVQAGGSYTLTLDHVTDCANGGTDATINVMVKNSLIGNIDVVANLVSTGVYAFAFNVPANDCETSPILYCNAPAKPNTGSLVGRHDTGNSQAHLRVSTWGPTCTNPAEVLCGTTPVSPYTWGKVKKIYR